MTRHQYFQTQRSPTALIVEILRPVGSLAESTVMAELDDVLDALAQSQLKNVVIDFRQTAYFGSSLLEALRTIWNRVHEQNGKMVLCQLSPVGLEILQVSKFDHLWPISETRPAAMEALQALV